jgi:S-DNA-T family DNA segregation ATPase FtsK/SpoIIIE
VAKKRKNQQKNNKKEEKKEGESRKFPEKIKRGIVSLLFFFFSIFTLFAFLNKAGVFGKIFIAFLHFLFGKASYLFIILFFVNGLLCLKSKYINLFYPLSLANIIFLLSLSAFLEGVFKNEGGIFGKIAYPFFKLFGIVVSEIIFGILILFSLFLFWLLSREERKEKEGKVSFFRKVFLPKLKVEKIESEIKTGILQKELPKEKPKKFFSPPPDGYIFPPVDLLEKEEGVPLAGDIQRNLLIIKKTLEHFGINVEMGEVNIGPTVTQYTLKPAEGIKLSKITALSNDLALALAAHPVRIEAPIPGKSLVGIEVPNKKRAPVKLRALISHPSFQLFSSPLVFPLGLDVAGEPIFVDLGKMPHLLVAGATGTGKTIFLNNIIISLIYRNSPNTLRFILIDPKRVEFPVYNELCHLMVPVIFHPSKAVLALEWLIGEMERRFDVLAQERTKDIESFNNKVRETKEKEPLPYIVVVIDELADLMVAKGKEIESKIVRLAQLARAVGIHLILATQRPSVEVITGLIKANITCRVSFQVASQVDSRTILDVAGAEKLLGSGDLLYLSSQSPKPKRVQAPYLSEREVKRVVNFIQSKNSHFLLFANHLSKELQEALSQPEGEREIIFEGKEDPLFEEAKRIVIEAQRASASLLQRRLSIGYARAARLLDMLEEKGIVGPADGAKPRIVYAKREEDSKEDNLETGD